MSFPQQHIKNDTFCHPSTTTMSEKNNFRSMKQNSISFNSGRNNKKKVVRKRKKIRITKLASIKSRIKPSVSWMIWQFFFRMIYWKILQIDSFMPKSRIYSLTKSCDPHFFHETQAMKRDVWKWHFSRLVSIFDF